MHAVSKIKARFFWPYSRKEKYISLKGVCQEEIKLRCTQGLWTKIFETTKKTCSLDGILEKRVQNTAYQFILQRTFLSRQIFRVT